MNATPTPQPTDPDGTEALSAVPDLTKWPRLLVLGEPVTREQANEILVRTAHWHYMHSNDKEWTRTVNELAGVELDEHGWPDYKSTQAFCDRMGVLDLEYLTNSRIASSWIGGPHGWCDWDGQIGCSSHNIGKWPSIEQVVEEWELIAVTFPYLTLRSQLIAAEGEGVLAVEFWISGGEVRVIPRPNLKLCEQSEITFMAPLRRHGERGVSVERLREALDQVRAAVSS